MIANFSAAVVVVLVLVVLVVVMSASIFFPLTPTIYSPSSAVGTVDGEVISELIFRNNLRYVDNDEFVVGFDTRVDVSYQLTRHFQIRTGMQLIDMGRGIWRGQITDRTDQSVLAVGATFGIALNR